MNEPIEVRTVEIYERRILLKGVGTVHCAFCGMLATAGDRCLLFGKPLDLDQPTRLQYCVDNEVKAGTQTYEPEPEPDPQHTVAWRPR